LQRVDFVRGLAVSVAPVAEIVRFFHWLTCQIRKRKVKKSQSQINPAMAPRISAGFISGSCNWNNAARFLVRDFGAGAMGPEPYDHGPVGTCAQSTVGARFIVSGLGRADYYWQTAGRRSLFRRIHWDNANERQTVRGKRVGFPSIVGGQIDSETPVSGMSGPDNSVGVFLVRISETAFADIGPDYFAQCRSVNSLATARQIPSDVMPPQLALWQCSDFLAQVGQVIATGRDLIPIHGRVVILCIAVGPVVRA
jgi:hypothetical protein